MADLNTGTNIILSEADTQRKDGAEHAIPGAFPATPGTSAAPSDFIGDSHVAGASKPMPPGQATTGVSQPTSTSSAVEIHPMPPPQAIIGGLQPTAASRAVPSYPVPPRQTEVGTGNVAPSTGLQQRIPRHDENPASRFKGVQETSVPGERSPVEDQDKSSNDTVKPAELAQEVGESAATAAVASGIAAKDAAVWTKDRAVENYPAARDAVAENATWAKDRVVENYPAVRDQTVNAASTAGNTAYSGAATAAATIASTAQAAYNATAGALTKDTQADTLPPASDVPEPVKDSIAAAGKSPEAAANPAAVDDKRALESELLAIAGSGADKKTDTTTSRAAETSVASRDKKPSTLESKGPFAGHIPNRTESTDFVKIIGTETYKPHSSPGLGAAAQETKPAHGGGPAAPNDAGKVTGSAVLNQGGMVQEPETSYTHDKNTSRRNDMYPQGTGIGGQSSGIVGGTPRSMHSSSEGDHVAPPTGTSAQAPGHGPVEGNPPRYNQAQEQGRAPVKTTVGNNAVKEVEYNKLSSGTQSGVAGTHYESK
ncbi:hypothetical protein RB595_006080 [Gaeumannomyces hyphopodioides]